MFNRFPLAPFLLLTAALAGCAGSDDAGAAGDDDPLAVDLPARELDWTLSNCVFVAAVLQVPASLVQPLVPEGFRVMHAAEFSLEGAAGQPLPSPPAGGDDGNIGVEAFQCEEGTGLDGEVIPGMTYASYYTGVEPPVEFRRPDTAFYFVKWDVMIPDEARRNLLADYGVPVHNGSATMGVSTVSTPAGLAQIAGDLNFGDLGHYSFAANALAPYPEDRCNFVEYTPVPGGFVEWTMHCAFLQGGVGPLTVDVPAGSWFADLIGPGSHDGLGFVGRVDFGPGSLKLPAVPAST